MAISSYAPQRKMKTLTEELCGKEISSTHISRLPKILDEEVQKFKTRKLGRYRYLFLDAQYEKVHYEGSVRSLAVLKAIGINEEGIREILGISTIRSRSALEEFSRRFTKPRMMRSEADDKR